MRALLLALLAVAWLEDGLLRRFVDARLHRRAATGAAWFLASGLALGGAAFASWFVPGGALATLLVALALAMTGFGLAPARVRADAAPARGRAAATPWMRRAREAAPVLAAVAACTLLVLARGDATARDAGVVAAASALLLAVRALFPPLQARLAASRLPARWQAVPAPLLVAMVLALSAAALLPT